MQIVVFLLICLLFADKSADLLLIDQQYHDITIHGSDTTGHHSTMVLRWLGTASS
jgi:hypothetical protein